MAEQQRKSKPTSKSKDTEVDDVELKSDEKKSEEIKEDLVDEIDGVLETNAEEFVKNYVQKGGQ